MSEPEGFNWSDFAICRGLDPDWFHPLGGSGRLEHLCGRSSRDCDQTAVEEHEARAKRICAACPVRQNCLDAAVALASKAEGVWGGTTERERRRLAAATGRPFPNANEQRQAQRREAAREMAAANMDARTIAARLNCSKRQAQRLLSPVPAAVAS